MSKKWSVIWNFFCEDEDIKYTACNKCRMKVPRDSSSTKSYTTTNVFQQPWKEGSSGATAKMSKDTGKRTLQQLSLETIEELTKTWDIYDPRAKTSL